LAPAAPAGAPALLVRDGTPAVQSIRTALRSGVVARLTTSAPGTWRLQLRAGRKVVGSAVKRATAAGVQSAKVKLNAAGRRRFRRARSAT